MLKDYVRMGGGLLTLGGYYSYGKGRLAGSPLAELLPVVVGDPFDLRRAGSGHPAPGPATPAFNLPGLDSTTVEWFHQVAPGADAQVYVTIGGQPLLLGCGYGNGRVLSWTGTALGEAFPGAEGHSAIPPEALRSMIGWLKARQVPQQY